jgi:UDP-glucose 4-epimerase
MDAGVTEMPRSVLVTGGNGFIGRHVVKRLLKEGHDVTLLQRCKQIVPGVRELLCIDPLAPEALQRALSGRRFDWVVHLAAYGVAPADREIESMFRINVDLTRRLVEVAAAWRARAIFVAGSGSEYALADVDGPVGEDHPLEAFELYGASKAAGGLCALAIARTTGLPLAVGRMFGVYGPGEAPHRLLASLVRHLRVGRLAPLSDGSQRRDFVYVEDVVDAIMGLLTALENGRMQTVVNIATGRPASVRMFAESVAETLGAPMHLLGFGKVAMRPHEVACFSGDPTRLHALTGWNPQHSLTSGIDHAIRRLAEEVQP